MAGAGSMERISVELIPNSKAYVTPWNSDSKVLTLAEPNEKPGSARAVSPYSAGSAPITSS